jgi:ATP-dependent DNA helicase RecG
LRGLQHTLTTAHAADILNPIFAEVETLSGVGPQVAKLLKRLEITRIVDLLYHLPTGVIERVRARAASPSLLGMNVILDVTPFQMREPRSGRGPMRVFASDAEGNTVSLIYFNNPGWAKKSLPLHEKRTVAGKLEAYGDEWQIIHPEVLAAEKGAEISIREPVYPLTEGMTGKRLRELATAALERTPDLPEWIEPGLLGREVWRPWRSAIAEAHRDPGSEDPRRRLAYDEIFANQLALVLLRQASRRKSGVPLPGTGELIAKLKLPYELTGAQRRVIEEIRGDMAQSAPMLPPASGRRRLGQDACRADVDAHCDRVRSAVGLAGANRDTRSPAPCDLARTARQHRSARCHPDRS